MTEKNSQETFASYWSKISPQNKEIISQNREFAENTLAGIDMLIAVIEPFPILHLEEA